MRSVEASLKRLRTDYIDLYWLHIWDRMTPPEEVMRAFDDLVRQGKILHAGVSDMAAWAVARANTLAELRGWSPFVGLQIEYSLIERTVERELLPMAQALGVGVTAWSPLGGGVLTGKYAGGEAEGVPSPTRAAEPVAPVERRTGERRRGRIDGRHFPWRTAPCHFLSGRCRRSSGRSRRAMRGSGSSRRTARRSGSPPGRRRSASGLPPYVPGGGATRGTTDPADPARPRTTGLPGSWLRSPSMPPGGAWPRAWRSRWAWSGGP
jgi:hypothetical protein